MNQEEYKKSGKFKGKHLWYNKTRKIQKSLQHNEDPKAKVIHHLRDTEEQREYNDTYYEFWGFNQDGTFEYGKYVIFVTKKQHTEIHKCSEETRNKISTTLKKTLSTDEQKLRRSKSTRGESNPFYGKHHSDETKEIIKQKSNAYWSLEESRIRASKILKQHFKDNPVSEETRRKLSESNKGRIVTEDTINRIKYSRAHSAKVAEHNKDMQVCKEHYSLIKEYKFISWNNFQKLFKNDYYLLKATMIILCHAAMPNIFNTCKFGAEELGGTKEIK